MPWSLGNTADTRFAPPPASSVNAPVVPCTFTESLFGPIRAWVARFPRLFCGVSATISDEAPIGITRRNVVMSADPNVIGAGARPVTAFRNSAAARPVVIAESSIVSSETTPETSTGPRIASRFAPSATLATLVMARGVLAAVEPTRTVPWPIAPTAWTRARPP